MEVKPHNYIARASTLEATEKTEEEAIRKLIGLLRDEIERCEGRLRSIRSGRDAIAP